ncbi:MAG TPA: hypothetical protein VE325_05315, partial [Burkholderiales bacterium]|nr:hypothetical protein [Burkholderiales bacterium]
HLRRHITLGAALLTIAVGSVQACPNHSTKTATTVAPHRVSSARAAALLAWKPRAWAPATAAAPRAQGLRVAIDPVDGTMGMPTGAPAVVAMTLFHTAEAAAQARRAGADALVGKEAFISGLTDALARLFPA